MTTALDAPADTRMMRIVHEALRRDIRRAQATLTRNPPPPVLQQQAIAAHLTWMMRFMRDHHRSEDEGLYPFVRRRDPAAADLLDAMHTEHEVVAAAIADVEAAGAGELVAALDRLSQVLLPHLKREEDEVLPVVSAAITNAEWRALEDQYNLDPKSVVQLARAGHWLIDDAGPQDRQAVLGLVSPVRRFMLLHGFAGSYRRHAARCWAQPASSGRRVQKSGRCEVVVDVPIDAVWDVVRDVGRVGEWSHECLDITWLDGATGPAPGARFRGRNRAGVFRWGRVCEIVVAEPHQLVWRTVPTKLYPDSTRWTIRLDAVDGGTRIEQSFDVERTTKLDLVYALVIPTHRDRTAALTDDMRRLGNLAVNARHPVR